MSRYISKYLAICILSIISIISHADDKTNTAAVMKAINTQLTAVDELTKYFTAKLSDYQLTSQETQTLTREISAQTNTIRQYLQKIEDSIKTDITTPEIRSELLQAASLLEEHINYKQQWLVLSSSLFGDIEKETLSESFNRTLELNRESHTVIQSGRITQYESRPSCWSES